MNIAALTRKLIQRIDQKIDDIAHHHLLDKLSDFKKRSIKNINSILDYAAQHPSIKFIDEHSKKIIGITQQVISFIFVKCYELFDWFISILITATKSALLWTLKSLKGFGRDSLSLFQQSFIGQKIKQYALLIRFNKPIGTLLLLWPTLIALWIAAEGWPDEKVLVVFTLGVFLMRSAGCAINDYADRNIDDKVQRTKNRPLASKAITPTEALWVFAVLSLSAFTLVLTMNKLTIVLSFIGLTLAASYPFMKRHHYLPQVHLGAAFGWAVPMAYAAQANELTEVTWLLFIATVLWATAYDTMYAMVDRDDDIKIGVKSTAILFGSSDKIIIGAIQCFLILDLLLIGLKLELSGIYYLSVIIASGFAAYQQYLIKDRDKKLCFKAFLNNNWFGLVLFSGVFLEYKIGGF